MAWSHLIDTEIGRVAKFYYDHNNLEYHNWNHILRLYDVANILNIPYDINLDAAILFHDAIYDDLADKELRSAKLAKGLLVDMVTEGIKEAALIDSDLVYDLIMDTATHENTRNDDRIIILDLFDIGVKECRERNSINIIAESTRLYDITEEQCLISSKAFMSNLLEIAKSNLELTTDYRSQWTDIINGIDTLI